jgi:hypothetical protein
MRCSRWMLIDVLVKNQVATGEAMVEFSLDVAA